VAAEIARHKTAIIRNGLSRPLQRTMADGLLNADQTLLDYGCGRGKDVRLLSDAGISCSGWDPVHAPEGQLQDADVVNLGYVVNVIEDPRERRETLIKAWAHAKRTLVVSARLTDEAPAATASQRYADGIVTRLGTFQKFFEQQELRAWIEQALETACVAAAPGIFYVFRDAAERAAFQASRFRRSTAQPRLRAGERLLAEHRELFEHLASFICQRGRLPALEELPSARALEEAVGSLKKAFRILQQSSDPHAWEQAQESRTEDLLVFVALSRFDGRPKFSDLPLDMQLDVKAFFGTYTEACRRADDLLFSLGHPDRINEACASSPLGKILPTALYAHVSAVPKLPLLLRLYEGCARGYVGEVPGTTLVKLVRDEPRITYLSYPTFDRDPHPPLAASYAVHLQTFRTKQRAYTDFRNPPVLHRKETFLATDHPHWQKYARLTKAEEAKGLLEDTAKIGTRDGWLLNLQEHGLSLRGHRLVKRYR